MNKDHPVNSMDELLPWAYHAMIDEQKNCLIIRSVDAYMECFVTKKRDKRAALKFLIKTMRKHGLPEIITTDKCPSYWAAFRAKGVENRQLCGGRTNNRCENSHLPFRRREQTMQKFKSAATLQKIRQHSRTNLQPLQSPEAFRNQIIL